VAKDNDNDGNINPAHATEGRVWLYIRTVAGTWGQKTIVQPDFSQLPTRPSLLLDTDNNRAYVIYHDESPSGAGRNFIAHSNMDTPFFDFPCVLNATSSSNPTTTKQNLTNSMGMMVAASTGNTGSGEIIWRTVTLLPADNPVPNITNLSPSSALAGGAAFTLTVNGTNFMASSVIQWNSVDRTTTFVNSTQLTTQISAADISVASVASVTVENPAPGGGTSNSLNFSVNNPAPTLTSISPNTKTVGDGAFTLTANGSGFLNTSVIRINGNDRPTTFVNGNQLTAQMTAADVQTGGQFPITVSNPGPGGGLSSAVNLTVNNPTPSVTSLSPNTKNVGDPAFTITVNGSNFVSGAVVRINGSDRTTTFFSSIQLTAQITAADVQSAGSFPVTVFNPAPGGGVSNSSNLVVNNLLPVVSNISPTSKTAGDAAFVLTVNGGNFLNGSVVRYAGSDRTTTFVNSGQLTAQITSADVQTAGSFGITVFNPAPGGGLSNSVNLTVNPAGGGNPVPTISSLSPNSATAGGAAFTLTVNGTNYIAGSVVRWGGSDRTTSFVNANQVTAQITAADIASSGSVNVTVFNPAPGGGLSGNSSFTINPVGGCVGYESDVAPRPNGNNNGSITISDWVQTGRFSAGLDTPAPGCEFQRADSAGRATLGNGAITVSDWVQAGRYAAGLDPATPVGGPTGLSPETFNAGAPKNLKAAAGRLVRAVGTTLTPGQPTSVTIEFDSQGDENALGFSVTFDQNVLTYVSATAGSGASGATLNVNPGQAASGKLGFAVSQPAGATFSAGTKQLITINFNVAGNANGSTNIGFGDQPVFREVVDPNVQELATTYTGTTLTINGAPPAPQVQFSSATFDIGEGAGSATINVSRTGDTSGASAVDFSIVGAGNYVICSTINGQAVQNCDYTITAGTLSFAAGETTKSFTVPVVEDAYVEGNEALTLKLENASGASLGAQNQASLNIQDNDSGQASNNPIDQAGTFVRQQYLDFLNREPDQGGFDYWVSQITSCGSDLACIHSRRIGVSGAFFVELEFQRTGSVVYRLYKAAFGQRPLYAQFMPDRSQLIDGPQLPATTAALAAKFVERPEFKAAYPDSMTSDEYVNKLFDSAGLMNNPSQRQAAIDSMQNSSKTRSQVLLDVIEITEFKDREYNPSFVLMEYFGYLRRDPDSGGYDFWLDVINNREPNNYRSMMCAFLTSTEYQERFGSVITRSNADCAQQ
jgi:hypothetical protein